MNAILILVSPSTPVLLPRLLNKARVVAGKVVVLEVDREGDKTTGREGTGSTRIGQAMAIKAAHHIPILATPHHHHQGGTGVAGAVPDSIGGVITGMTVINTEGGMEDIEDTKHL